MYARQCMFLDSNNQPLHKFPVIQIEEDIINKILNSTTVVSFIYFFQVVVEIVQLSSLWFL